MGAAIISKQDIDIGTRATMNRRKLGNSDLKITPIGFGAWAVGGPWRFG